MQETIMNLVMAAVLFIKLLLLFLQRRGFFLPFLLYPEPWNTGSLRVSVPTLLEPLNLSFHGEADSDHQYLTVQTAFIALLLMQTDFSWYLQCSEHLQKPPISHVILIIIFLWLSLVLYIQWVLDNLQGKDYVLF